MKTKYRHIPENYKQTVSTDHCQVYESETNGKFTAMMFQGKRSKPTNYYMYQSADKRNEGIDRFIKSVTQIQAQKDAYKANQKKQHTLEVGQIMVSSWGYDQTNVDFYKIIELKGKTQVVIQKLSTREVEGSQGYMCNNVMPVEDELLGQPFTKKANGFNSIKLNTYASASVWDGKPKYESWYA